MPVNPIHSEDELEVAYMTWAYECDRNLTQTADKVGIPLRTLQYRKQTLKWDERYAEETGNIAGFAFTAALNEMQLGVSSVAHQIIRDATNEALDHSDRIASQRLFLSLFNPEQSGPSVLSLIDARQQTINASLDSGLPDPHIQASRILEANIVDALGQQTKTRRK